MIARFAVLAFATLEWILIGALAAMVVLVFGNVVLRYLFATGLPFAEELSRYLFVWITFLGAIVAMRDRLHIGLDGARARLPPRGRRIVAVVSGALVIACCVVLADGSLRQTHMNLAAVAQVSGIPMFLVYAMPAIAAVGIAGFAAADVLRALCGREDPRNPARAPGERPPRATEP